MWKAHASENHYKKQWIIQIITNNDTIIKLQQVAISKKAL